MVTHQGWWRHRRVPEPVQELPIPPGLPLYRVAAWPGTAHAANTDATVTSQGPVVCSAGVYHHGWSRQRLLVESHYTRNEPADYAQRKQEALRRVIADSRTGTGPDMATGPWMTEALTVNGAEATYETINVQPKVWAGVIQLPSVIVTIEALGVNRSKVDLSLVPWQTVSEAG